MRLGAIVLAAGSSTRMATSINKPYVAIRGHRLLWYSLTAFDRAGVSDVVIVARREDSPLLESESSLVVEGGDTRTASEMSGLAALEGRRLDVVLIHDGARPFLRPEMISRLAQVAFDVGGAVPGLTPAADLWRRTDGELTALEERVVRVQTPQAFQWRVVRDAYRAAGRVGATGADTAEIVQRFGISPVALVPGDPALFKVTYDHDLARAEAEADNWWQDVGQ